MSVFDMFWSIDMRHLHNMNDALMVLLPMSTDAVTVRDYRPIALIHSINKLIAKVLATGSRPSLLSWCTPARMLL
jgi:hypothetical protein